MALMSVTAEVSKPDRSRDASDEQPENMPPMSVASRPRMSAEAMFPQLENIPEASPFTPEPTVAALTWSANSSQGLPAPRTPSPPGAGAMARLPASSMDQEQPPQVPPAGRAGRSTVLSAKTGVGTKDMTSSTETSIDIILEREVIQGLTGMAAPIAPDRVLLFVRFNRQEHTAQNRDSVAQHFCGAQTVNGDDHGG